MNAQWKQMTIGALLGMVALAFTACSNLDNELQDCEPGDADFTVHYEVRLKTSLTTQVETILNSRYSEPEVAKLLEDSLKDIFREYAHDVDLSFYTEGQRTYFDHHIMDANQAVYELELPANDYRHLALANFAEEPTVSVVNETAQRDFYIRQDGGEELPGGHSTGLFTARKNMNVIGNTDQTFDVTLYMVNSASILLVRTDNVSYQDIRVTSSDFADGFNVDDSTYTFNTARTVDDLRVTRPPVEREVFYTITFPSCSSAEQSHHYFTRADGETGSKEENSIWRKYVYVTLPDGTITRTILNVGSPLLPGEVYIIYAYMNPDGSITSPNVEVGTSVTLDWKDGLIINPKQ